MAVVSITSPIIRHAPLLASAQITGIDIRREACWFVITVVPFPEEKGDYHQLNGSYKIFRRFEHFQYFANYIQVECNSSNCQVPKLKTRKRLLFSKVLYAERRKEDLNVFLMKVFQLPLKVKSSLCFAEFLGIWKGDLKENGLDETSFTRQIDYLGRELSPEAKKLTAATMVQRGRNFDSFNQRPHVRNHPHKQRHQEWKKSNVLPSEQLRKGSTEEVMRSDAAVQRAKTCLANSLQSHYTTSTPWNNLKKTPSLKVAPWNIRHLTPKEMLALEDKRQSLVRSHTYTLGVKRSMHFVSPFIRAKVILNAEHIINFLVPRNIQLDELRQRVFCKFNNSGVTEYDREETIVLCYKRDNKVVIVATNEDLRKIIVDTTDKFTFYLPSNSLLEEFFWMREVIEIQESLLKKKPSTRHPKQSASEPEKASQNRKSRELQRASSRRQTALVSLQRQNTLANFRKSGLTSSAPDNPNRNSFAVKTRSSTGSYRARRVRHSDRQYRTRSKNRSSPIEPAALLEEPVELPTDQIYEIVLDSKDPPHFNIRPDIKYDHLRQLVVKKPHIPRDSLKISEVDLFANHLTYRTSEHELVHLASREELSILFATLSPSKNLEKLPVTKQTLYLLPQKLFTLLKQDSGM